MALKKAPFRVYQDDEDIMEKKKKTWTISVRVNREEQKMIHNAKKMLNIGMDTTALKLLAKVGYNVLQGTFGAGILKYLTDPARRRDNLESDKFGLDK